MTAINALFASDIYRAIEEVIKVDQTNEEIVKNEISEYVITRSIENYFIKILEKYQETPNKPHEGIGLWVSGFFGSGKSSFAKILGLTLDNRSIMNEKAADLFAAQTGSRKIKALLSVITEQIPTEAVIFDVSTDRGIRSGSQRITEIMYRLFLQHLGYARDLDLSELEITLEAEGRLDSFKQTFHRIFSRDWDKEKGKIAFAIQQASRVMHELEPETYPEIDSWRQSARNRADITPGLLAARCKELMARRRPGQNLLFVIDEVGQFVARDVQKMLDLQAVVQSLGRVGRGTMWLVVTSQEKLNELVSGLDDSRVELARLMDRFPTQVHLEPSDISEVTSKRVLSKNAEAQKILRDVLNNHRCRLIDNTNLTADIQIPEIMAENFIDLYPLLPYQIDLIIQVVSGLRMQGGLSKHVGGANRTIIKLAQQVLIHPDVNLAEQPVPTLVRIDHMYDLVAGNLPGEIRGKIDAIKRQVDHSFAQPVAKAVCLLQYVKSIHRTAENIAAALHPSVVADSQVPLVKEALEALTKASMIRQGDDGYRIPTPAEDDWERQRTGLKPRPGDMAAIHRKIVTELWHPQPQHSFMDTKMFKAGLFFNGRQIVDGDIFIHLILAEAGKEYETQAADMRKRSQTEKKSIFWIGIIDQASDHETVEFYRSEEILSRKERGAQTKTEAALVAEEKARLRRHHDELKRLLKQACLCGSLFFQGNDRSPDDSALDIVKTAAQTLAQSLPRVFYRFEEAAARTQKKDLDAVMTSDDLRGLPPIFTNLKLVHDQAGKPMFNTDTGPLTEVLARIKNRTDYGETASGRYITDEFAKEPFGWEFDMVRLFVVSLLRAGKIEATSKGQVIESATGIEAKNTFSNNNLFRQASFQLKAGAIEIEDLIAATEAFKYTFGYEIPELEQTIIADSIKKETDKQEELLHEVHTKLVRLNLPGADELQETLDQIKAIGKSKEAQVISLFHSSHKKLYDAVVQANNLKAALTSTNLHTLTRAHNTLHNLWPFLKQEKDLPQNFNDKASELVELLKRQTFYKEFPSIDQKTKALEDEYQRRYHEAVQGQNAAYTRALEQLKALAEYNQLNEDQKKQIAAPLAAYAQPPDSPAEIPLLRADTDACQNRLNNALAKAVELSATKPTARINAAEYFKGGIETKEQLDKALEGLRQECESMIGAGKKVLIQ